MAGITQHIAADKAGMVKYLTEQRDYYQGRSDNLRSTQKQRERDRGTVDGLELAIRALENWTLPADQGFIEYKSE
jgi:hypothetical protein